jgi:hypothetical protein
MTQQQYTKINREMKEVLGQDRARAPLRLSGCRTSQSPPPTALLNRRSQTGVPTLDKEQQAP